MPLEDGDLEKVPSDLTARESYARICAWHRSNGAQQVQEREKEFKNLGLPTNSVTSYLRILAELPTDVEASDADMDFVFDEVVTSTFEWSYHCEDERGIKMAAYAFHAIDKRYEGSLEATAASARESKLAHLKF